MDDDEDQIGVSYELAIPFVAVTSVGGPFDDDAFSAGWEMGKLQERLRVAIVVEALPVTATIRRVLLKQADLICMHLEVVMSEIDYDDDVEGGIKTEWAMISVDYPPDTDLDQ